MQNHNELRRADRVLTTVVVVCMVMSAAVVYSTFFARSIGTLQGIFLRACENSAPGMDAGQAGSCHLRVWDDAAQAYTGSR